MVDDGRGGSVEGFQVHLGGSLGLDSGFGRKLRQHKVTSDELGVHHVRRADPVDSPVCSDTLSISVLIQHVSS